MFLFLYVITEKICFFFFLWNKVGQMLREENLILGEWFGPPVLALRHKYWAKEL